LGLMGEAIRKWLKGRRRFSEKFVTVLQNSPRIQIGGSYCERRPVILENQLPIPVRPRPKCSARPRSNIFDFKCPD
jgi:hypothetical protein